mmetsp:Transcript_21849/g.45964  ORF Transcript_21849/g.45964 Transcript_21849/m.45964 type:complete len:101 (+) Transcript_21849:241-543(+)
MHSPSFPPLMFGRYGQKFVQVRLFSCLNQSNISCSCFLENFFTANNKTVDLISYGFHSNDDWIFAEEFLPSMWRRTERRLKKPMLYFSFFRWFRPLNRMN